jgi:hypothetical protein
VCSARGQGIGHQSFDDRGLGISWPPTLLLALIHRSAWNRNSRKFTCTILNIALHRAGSKPLSPALRDRALRHLVTRMDGYSSW